VGALLPITPLAAALGLTPLPIAFFAILVAMIAAYLILVWTDLMELDPEPMRRAYGTNDLPAAWPAVRKELIAAIEQAWPNSTRRSRSLVAPWRLA
jgi:hypothetical protein